MTIRRVIIAAEVWDDLEDIRSYIAKDRSPEIARRVMAEILDATKLLSEMPGLGHTHFDLTEPYRVWRVFRFLIVYRFDARRLYIARVVHGHRDLRRILREN